MSSASSVKQYLACWFQLGKKVAVKNGHQAIAPEIVLQGDRYSQDFEDCWQYLLSTESGDCYLEGTQQTIEELLSESWEIIECSRCDMPIPVRSKGMPPECCPCYDLLTWPNTNLPMPRVPVNTQSHLRNLNSRLLEKEQFDRDEKSRVEGSFCWFHCPNLA